MELRIVCKALTLLFILSCISFNRISAQSLSRTVICSSGSTVSAGNYSISYVLGEAVGDLFSNDPKLTYLTAGFAQPDLTVPETFSNNDYVNANFTIFPNPAVGNTKIKLGFKSLPNGRYNIAIIDPTGKSSSPMNFIIPHCFCLQRI